MGIQLGSLSINKRFVGDTEIKKSYFGNTLIYDKTGGGWLPSDLPNLALWLDASDLSTIIESAGKVSQWSDKSGNNNHALQPLSANQPSTGLDTINGLNTISFDGLLTCMGLDPIQVLTGNVGVYVVVRNNPVTAFNGMIFGQFVGTSTRHSILHRSGSATRFDNSNVRVTQAYQSGIHQMAGYRNGSEIGGGFDGVMTTALTGVDFPTLSTAVIGCDNPNNRYFFDGDIAEIIVDLDYSEATRANVEAYFLAKWGV